MNFDAITIDKDVQKTFNNLPRSLQRKVYMRALRAGARPVRDAAEANLRSVSEPFTGLSRARGSVTVYALKKYRGSYRVAVQVKRGLVNAAKKDGQGRPVRVAMYLAVLEYGSTKLGRGPRSWIRKAIRETPAEAIQVTAKEMARLLPEAVKDARR